MHSVVLRTGVGLEVVLVVALHTQYGLHAQHSIHIGILATGLLTTTPTGISEDIHIRTPERQLRIARIVDRTLRHVKQRRILMVRTVPVGTRLVAHLREHVVHQLGIEGCRHTDGLRIHRIASLAHTMTSLAPPVVGRDTQTIHRDRLVHHQSHLLVRCQERQQVLHTLLARELRIQEGILRLVLRILDIVEGVHIHIAALLLRGIVEDTKLGTHEEAAPVETEAVVLGTDLRPVLAVQAIVEIRTVLSTAPVLVRTEVSVDPQPHRRLVQRHALDGLLLELRHLLVTIRELHFLLVHLEHELLAFLLDGQRTRITVERCQTRAVAVLHLREVHQDRTRTGRTLHALRQCIRRQIERLHHTARL